MILNNSLTVAARVKVQSLSRESNGRYVAAFVSNNDPSLQKHMTHSEVKVAKSSAVGVLTLWIMKSWCLVM